MCESCGTRFCSRACQRAAWPQHRALCRALSSASAADPGELHVFYGQAHTSDTARGEFLEMRLREGHLLLRGEGDRARITLDVNRRHFTRLPTPSDEVMEGALLLVASNQEVRMCCHSRAAFYALRRQQDGGARRFCRHAVPGSEVVAAFSYWTAFCVILSSGFVYS